MKPDSLDFYTRRIFSQNLRSHEKTRIPLEQDNCSDKDFKRSDCQANLERHVSPPPVAGDPQDWLERSSVDMNLLIGARCRILREYQVHIRSNLWFDPNVLASRVQQIFFLLLLYGFWSINSHNCTCLIQMHSGVHVHSSLALGLHCVVGFSFAAFVNGRYTTAENEATMHYSSFGVKRKIEILAVNWIWNDISPEVKLYPRRWVIPRT